MDGELQSNIKLVLFIFAIILCVWLIKMLFPVITLVIVAILVVYIMSPIVSMLVNLRIPQPAAAVIVFLLFLATILLLFYFTPPLIYREFSQLAGYMATDFHQYMTMLFVHLEQMDAMLGLDMSNVLISTINSFLNELPALMLQGLQQAAALRVPLLSELWSLLGLLFLTFFLLLDIDRVKATLVKFSPPAYRKEAAHVIGVIDSKVGAYLRGNVIRCSIVGVATGMGLYLMGMPFALLLGITAGILNIIHNIGPFMAAIPAVLISFTPATPHPLMIFALYLTIQIIDPFILTPFLLGKAVDLRPITVIIAILCGARLMGFLGIILAIPFTAVVKVLLNHYYISWIEAGMETGTKKAKETRKGIRKKKELAGETPTGYNMPPQNQKPRG